MNQKVTMHTIEEDSTIEGQCINLASRLDKREQKIVDRKKFQFLFNYFYETIHFLRYNNLAFCSLDSEKTYIQKASKYIANYAASLSKSENTLSLEILDTTVNLEITKFEDMGFLMVNSFYITILNNEDQETALLKDFDIDLISFPDKLGFQYQKNFIRLLSTYLFTKTYDSRLDLVLLEIANSAEEVLAEFKPDFSYKIYLHEPLVQALKALDANDQNGFNKYIFESLSRHKEYWSSKQVTEPGAPPLQRQSEGWLSMEVLALMKLGINSGLKLEVESDYAPNRFLDL